MPIPLDVGNSTSPRESTIENKENKRRFLEVDAEVMEQVDPIFYSDPVAARKGLGLA